MGFNSAFKGLTLHRRNNNQINN